MATASQTRPIDGEKLNALLGQAVQDMGAALHATLIIIGDKLGLYRAMADSAPVLLWLADTGGRRFYFNKPWLQATGRPMEDQVGEGWLAGVHPQDVSHCRHRYTTAVKSCGRRGSAGRSTTSTNTQRPW